MSWLTGRVVDWSCGLAIVIPPAAVVATDQVAGQGWSWGALVCLLGIAGALRVSRTMPLVGTVAAAPLAFVLQTWAPTPVVNAATPGLLLVVFVLELRLGATPPWSCVVGTSSMFAGIQVGQVFNPLTIMLTVGPCAIGIVLASQRRLGERLAEQAVEITRERSRYVEEAIRYERARIARDLHDVVAHCVSLIVVQAGAGQRVAGDPEAELETFDNISAAVSQAQTEIDLLVDLLAVVPTQEPVVAGIALVRELVERARATGMSVDLEVDNDLPALAPATGELVYRISQEGLTNALKHAPGAAVTVSIRADDHETCVVTVENAAAMSSTNWPSLHQDGGGFGIPGLTERVAAVGGRLRHGPTASSGWALEAVLPTGVDNAEDADTRSARRHR